MNNDVLYLTLQNIPSCKSRYGIHRLEYNKSHNYYNITCDGWIIGMWVNIFHFMTDSNGERYRVGEWVLNTIRELPLHEYKTYLEFAERIKLN